MFVPNPLPEVSSPAQTHSPERTGIKRETRRRPSPWKLNASRLLGFHSLAMVTTLWRQTYRTWIAERRCSLLQKESNVRRKEPNDSEHLSNPQAVCAELLDHISERSRRRCWSICAPQAFYDPLLYALPQALYAARYDHKSVRKVAYLGYHLLSDVGR